MVKNNPFNPNSVVAPNLFAGRSRQVDQVIRKLVQVGEKRTANFVFYGERGIGKTALAKLIMYIAKGQRKEWESLNFLTTYYTIEKDQPFHSALQSSLNLLTDQLPKSAIDRMGSHLGSFFKDGKFSLGAFGVEVGVDTSQTSRPPEHYLKDQAVSIITNILKGIEEDKSTSPPNSGVLIVLDEIHNIKELSGVAQTLRGISTTLDMNGYGNVSFLIIGYPEAVMKFFEGDPSAKRSFDHFPLEIMPDDEATDILTKGFEMIGLKYEESFIKDNISQSGGYPHSIQVLGHNLVECDQDGKVDEVDWEQAIRKTALELQSKEYSNLYDFEGKVRLREEVLNVLAYMPGPVPKTDIASEFKKNGHNIYTKTCLPELKKTGAIKEELDTGHLSLQSYLFKSAIRFHLASKFAIRKKRRSKEKSPNWEKVIANMKYQEKVKNIKKDKI